MTSDLSPKPYCKPINRGSYPVGFWPRRFPRPGSSLRINGLGLGKTGHVLFLWAVKNPVLRLIVVRWCDFEGWAMSPASQSLLTQKPQARE